MGYFTYLEIFFPINNEWDKWADKHCVKKLIDKEEFTKIRSEFNNYENASDVEIYTLNNCDDGKEYIKAGNRIL